MTFVTQAVFSRMCCTTRKTVTKWKQEGRLVMCGQKVDVEATAEKMERTFHRGSPIVLPPEQATKQRTKPEAPSATSGVAGVAQRLLCVDIEAKLEALDWKQTFDWSDAAQEERVARAAECVGLLAVRSEIRDDGHWGGFQLRIRGELDRTPLREDAIAAGFGFELTHWDALEKIRGEIVAFDEDDEETVRPDLLPLLARPWAEYDKPVDSG